MVYELIYHWPYKLLGVRVFFVTILADFEVFLWVFYKTIPLTLGGYETVIGPTGRYGHPLRASLVIYQRALIE